MRTKRFNPLAAFVLGSFTALPCFAASPDIPGVPQHPEEAAKVEDASATQEKIMASFRNDVSLSDEARRADVAVGEDGRVTLRGIVRSQEEMAKIEGNAIRIAGNGRVVNHLEIRAPSHENRETK